MKRGECPKCNGERIESEPVKYDDGIISNDSEEAICLDCGHEFLIIYI